MTIGLDKPKLAGMKTLKAWLEDERGRFTALASHLGVSVGRVSQMADDGVPDKFKIAVRDFTEGKVSLEAMVIARTPPASADTPTQEVQ